METAAGAADIWLAHAREIENDTHIGRALNAQALIRNDRGLPVDSQIWIESEEHLRLVSA